MIFVHICLADLYRDNMVICYGILLHSDADFAGPCGEGRVVWKRCHLASLLENELDL